MSGQDEAAILNRPLPKKCYLFGLSASRPWGHAMGRYVLASCVLAGSRDPRRRTRKVQQH